MITTARDPNDPESGEPPQDTASFDTLSHEEDTDQPQTDETLEE